MPRLSFVARRRVALGSWLQKPRSFVLTTAASAISLSFVFVCFALVLLRMHTVDQAVCLMANPAFGSGGTCLDGSNCTVTYQTGYTVVGPVRSVSQCVHSPTHPLGCCSSFVLRAPSF